MRLAVFITENHAAILHAWIDFARDQLPAARDLDDVGLEDHGQKILEELVRNMESPQDEEERRRKSEGKTLRAGMPKARGCLLPAIEMNASLWIHVCSCPQARNTGWRELSTNSTIATRTGDQKAYGPNGVADQSNSSIRCRISWCGERGKWIFDTV